MLKGFDRPRAAPKRPGVPEQSITDARNQSRNGAANAVSADPRSRRVLAPAKSQDDPKIPHLNVITNFSKPNPASTKTPAMLIHSKNEPLQDRRRKGRLNGGSRDRIERLKADEPERGLSPSDRELMIGITIPGPPAGQPRKPSNDLKPPIRSLKPEIVVTPADQQPPEQLGSLVRGRVTSSIYSRYPNGIKESSPAPPLPRAYRRSVATSIDTSSRCTSWATDFSEDDTLQHSRPESRESERAILDRKSTDTIATKYRSRGWWNQILSPFLEHPELPKEINLDEDESQLPGDPRAGNWKIEKDIERKQVCVDSIWADLTGQRPAQRADKFFDESKDPTFNDYPGVHRGAMVDSPAVLEGSAGNHEGNSKVGLPFPGDRSPEIRSFQDMGLAAEYFEAYWHDQNHPDPYFKCENHLCSYGRDISASAFGQTAATTDDCRLQGLGTLVGPGGIDEDGRERGNAINETAESRVDRVRPLSEATVIEEDSADSLQEKTRELPQARAAKIKQPPIPAVPAEPPSPEAMTPSLRTDFSNHKALPLEPTRNRSMPADEPAPRYPPMGGLPANPRPALVPPPPVSAVSPPSSHEHREDSTNAQASGEHSLPTSQPGVQVHQYFGSGADRGGPREINDPHTWIFPPPPGAGPASKENRHVAQADGKPKKVGLLKRIFGGNKGSSKERKKRRRLFWCIFTGLLLMVILIIVLVVELTLPRSDMSAQTSWLNITGFPPIPTGIATIVRPDVQAVDGCIAPPTMWSCALPKEQQPSIQPNPGDQPNFRVEIRFQNGTNLTSSSNSSKRSLMSQSRAVQLLRRHVLGARDSFTSGLFTPNPPPPSTEDQDFLGNTTDHNEVPYVGEATPFYMSILNADSVSGSSRRLLRRQSSSGNSTNSTDPFPDLANDIPPPAINSDGTAAAANLYPFPTAQPLMLYDRGAETEHYGFYTYFDRSIFLKSGSVANLTTIGVVPDDEDGGATEAEASLRCTWAQTRFLVQIWTNSKGNLPLLPSNGTTSGASGSSNSSANDFTPPGSFPYPVSITMDRHGGDINEKSVYCYGVNDREQIVESEKQFQLENRAFDGHLVNPALGLFTHINVSTSDGGPGGIDGGSGGCSCLWRNFNAN